MQLTSIATSVEDYLNSVSYSSLDYYEPSDFGLEFVSFIKLVNGAEGTENKTPPVHYKIIDSFISDQDVINMCHRGMAKALALDELVYTDSGTMTIKDVQEEDLIYGEDGELTRVTAKSRVFHDAMYKITLADGRSIKVSKDHINAVIHRRQKRVGKKRVNYLDRRNLTTEELLEIPLKNFYQNKETQIIKPIPLAYP